MLGWILNLVQRGAASMTRLGEILNAKAEVVEPSDPIDPGEIRGEVEFRNLTFSYGTTEMLRGITLKIPAGSRVGIVGVVGSGKSTLVRMIPRLFPVPDGTVFIDGVDLNRISMEKIRAAVGFVPQEGFLFSRSIAENIAFGKPGATQEEIEAAAKAAQAHEFIMTFSEGYNTIIGERGVTLSGGQRQRLALARAFLTDPRILMLDDSTSAIDSATEDKIQQAIYAAAKGRTTFIITHRLSQIRWADLLLVVRGGRLSASGTHEDLLKSSEAYRRIFSE
jgi:ATP-binding cassette subfamily B protein